MPLKPSSRPSSHFFREASGSASRTSTYALIQRLYVQGMWIGPQFDPSFLSNGHLPASSCASTSASPPPAMTSSTFSSW